MRSSMRGQRAQAFLLTTAILVSYNLVAATEVSGSVSWAADARQQRHNDRQLDREQPFQASFASFQLAGGHRSLQQEQLNGVPTGGQGVASGGGGVDETSPWPPPLVPLPLTIPPQPGADVPMTVLPTLLNFLHAAALSQAPLTNSSRTTATVPGSSAGSLVPAPAPDAAPDPLTRSLLAHPDVARALADMRNSWVAEADKRGTCNCGVGVSAMPLYFWPSSSMPLMLTLAKVASHAHLYELDPAVLPMPYQWRPAMVPNGSLYNVSTGYVPSNVLRAQIRNAMWTPQRDQGPSTTFSGPSRLEEQEQVLWLVSAASIRSLPPNRLGHVLMLWYRTDVLAALARGNDTRGGGGASGNGTPAAAGTNAAAANGTAGGSLGGAGVDEDAAAAAEAAAAARAVPATWQALLQLVAALNGTDWDGDGRVKYGICLNRDPVCDSSYVVNAIAASMTQTHGTAQGFLWDPADPPTASSDQPSLMRAIYGTAAYETALMVYGKLLSYAPPAKPKGQGASLYDNCEAYLSDFAQRGLCALAIQWEYGILAQITRYASTVSGRLGVSPLPGSTHVLDRPTGRLLPCTPQRCPHATLEVAPLVAAADAASTAAAETVVPATPRRAARSVQEQQADPQPVFGRALGPGLSARWAPKGPAGSGLTFGLVSRAGSDGPGWAGRLAGLLGGGGVWQRRALAHDSPAAPPPGETSVTAEALAAVPAAGVRTAEQLVNRAPLAGVFFKERPDPGPNWLATVRSGFGSGNATGPGGGGQGGDGGGSTGGAGDGAGGGGGAGGARRLHQDSGNSTDQGRGGVEGLDDRPLDPFIPGGRPGSVMGDELLPWLRLQLTAPPRAPYRTTTNEPFLEDDLKSLWIFYGDMLLGMLPPLSTAATPATLLAALPYGLELGRLLSYGIQPGDARRWAVSYWRTVLHDNMALEPSVQGVPYLHMAISEAAYNVSKVAVQEAAGAGAGLGGGDRGALANEAAAAAAWMQGTYEDVMGKIYLERDFQPELLRAYRSLIGYVPPPPPRSENSGWSAHATRLVLAIALPLTVALALALGLLGLLLYRRNYLKVTLMGKVIAPGAGPDTTLVVTEVQGCAALREALPSGPLDAALALQQDAVRRLLPKHRGYECELDGDAFLLAFHRPHHAVAFCLELQVELLLLEWPPELAEHPDAATLWLHTVEPPPPHKQQQQQQQQPSALGPAIKGRTPGSSNNPPGGLVRWSTPSSPSSASTTSFSPIPQEPQQKRQQRQQVPAAPTPSTGTGPAALGPTTGSSSFRRARGRALEGSSGASGGGGGGTAAHLGGVLDELLWGGGGRAGERPPLPPLGNCPEQLQQVLQQVAGAGGGGGGGGAVVQAAAVVPGGGVRAGGKPSAGRRGGASGFPADDSADASLMTHSTSSGPAGAAMAAAGGSGGAGAGNAAGGPQLVSQTTGSFDVAPAVECDTTGGAVSSGAALWVPPQRRQGRSPLTLGAALKAVWVLSPSPSRPQAPAHGHVYRGLRVRMGMACGVEAGDVLFTRATGRTTYTGRALSSARAVCCSSLGGQVLLPHPLMATGPAEALRSSLAPLLLYVGDAELQGYHDTVSPAAASPGDTSVRRGGTRLGLPQSANDQIHNAATATAPVSTASHSAHTAITTPTSLVATEPAAAAATPTAAAAAAAASDASCTAVVPLYAALPPALAPRLVSYAFPESVRQTSHGSLCAPVGRAALAAMSVTGAAALRAWRADVAAAALGTWHDTTRRLLYEYGGYVVEASDGFLLAAFVDAGDAAAWGHGCTEAMLEEEWPDALLEHELCEEWAVVERRHPGAFLDAMDMDMDMGGLEGAEAGGGAAAAAAAASGDGSQQQQVQQQQQQGPFRRRSRHRTPFVNGYRHRVLLRGLRLKVGVDAGPVRHALAPATGRVSYKGRAVTRAGRIAALASSGQVLASGPAWEEATGEGGGGGVVAASGLVGICMGEHRLRGVSGGVVLYRLVSEDDFEYEQMPERGDGGVPGAGPGAGTVGEGRSAPASLASAPAQARARGEAGRLAGAGVTTAVSSGVRGSGRQARGGLYGTAEDEEEEEDDEEEEEEEGASKVWHVAQGQAGLAMGLRSGEGVVRLGAGVGAGKGPGKGPGTEDWEGLTQHTGEPQADPHDEASACRLESEGHLVLLLPPDALSELGMGSTVTGEGRRRGTGGVSSVGGRPSYGPLPLDLLGAGVQGGAGAGAVVVDGVEPGPGAWAGGSGVGAGGARVEGEGGAGHQA